MDYSAANTSLWNIIIQLGIIAGALLIANVLRNKVPFVKKSMMPVAVIAGFILLIVKYTGLIHFDAVLLEILVYHGIALGFIAMSLRIGKKTNSDNGGFKTAVKSGAIIVSTYLVQGVIGLIITITLAFTFMPNLFKASGLLLPMGFGQGPGQANNIGSSYQSLGFEGGHSFGLSLAAAGYLCACIVGVILLNVISKKHKKTESKASDSNVSVDFFQDKNELPVSDSIDRLSIQLGLVLLVYLLTYLLTWGITSGIGALSQGLASTVNTLLWGFNFIIGSAVAILVRTIISKAKKGGLMRRQIQNNYLLNRISGFFFDIMIVAGIAAIDINDLKGLWVPFVLLVIAGAVATWFFLKIVCKWAFPDYYYEGLMSLYGMLTGTISSGVLLLREIDPDYTTPAANNLVSGSSTGIIFGAPVLVLVTLAAKSDTLCLVTLGIAAAYLIILIVIIRLLCKKKSKN